MVLPTLVGENEPMEPTDPFVDKPPVEVGDRIGAGDCVLRPGVPSVMAAAAAVMGCIVLVLSNPANGSFTMEAIP